MHLYVLAQYCYLYWFIYQVYFKRIIPGFIRRNSISEGNRSTGRKAELRDSPKGSCTSYQPFFSPKRRYRTFKMVPTELQSCLNSHNSKSLILTYIFYLGTCTFVHGSLLLLYNMHIYIYVCVCNYSGMCMYNYICMYGPHNRARLPILVVVSS